MNSTRYMGNLAAPDVGKALTAGSILILPVGAMEQHGPHLPLNTDTILAERFAGRVIARWGDQYDLWQLPSFPYGISVEHNWAAGTLSHSAALFCEIIHELMQELTRTQAARKLVIVNGHGGNRGILEVLIQEIRVRHSIIACVVHPSALSPVKSNSKCIEVHGGKSETSILLELAPELVDMSKLTLTAENSDQETVKELILSRGATWPWSSNDQGISTSGIIGDPQSATIELGKRIVDGALAEIPKVLNRLNELHQQTPHSRDGD